MSEPAVEKRQVTMTTVKAVATDTGHTVIETHQAIDYVPLDLLGAYVTDANGRWQAVTVGDEHDPGPGGDDGATSYPAHLDHPLAGQMLNALPEPKTRRKG